MSEHSLKLKAVLDTREVQQELQKLRDAQQAAVGAAPQGTAASSNGINALNSTIGKLNASITQLQKTMERINTNAVKQKAPGQPSEQGTFLNPQMKQIMRTAIVTWGVNEIGNAAKSYYTNLGGKDNLKIARNIDYFQEITNSALQGAMVGSFAGPKGALIGAAVGAGTGALTGYLKDMAEEAKTAADRIKEFSTAIKEAAQFDKQVDKYFDSSNFTAQLKGLVEEDNPDFGKSVDEIARHKVDTPEEAEDRAAKYGMTAAKLKNLQTQLKVDLVEKETKVQTMPINFGYTSFEAMQAKLSELKVQREKMPDDSKVAPGIDAAIKVLEDSIAQCVKAFEDVTATTTKLSQVESAISQAESKQASEIQRSEQLKETEAKSLKAYRDTADKAWKTYKQDREARENQGDKLSNPKDRYNWYIKQANEADEKYRDTLWQSTFAGTAEETKALLEKAASYKQDYTFNKNQADYFGDSYIKKLQDKLASLKAPDMTAANSLATNGLMTNAVDDEARWKQQTEYLTQQTQIQREIRDRVNQMDAGSTFQ